MRANTFLAGAAMAALLAVTPAATAQEHVPSAEQAMALWCHGAMAGMSKAYAKDGNTTAAEADRARAEALRAKALALLAADNVSGEEAEALVTQYEEAAEGEIFKGRGEPQFEENDCNELAETP